LLTVPPGADIAGYHNRQIALLEPPEWLGWLGSAGGPEATSTPLGIAVLLTPSLFLAPAFVVLLVCIHQVTPPAQRVWSLTALTFGIWLGRSRMP